MPKLTINGEKIEVPSGQTVFEAAAAAGIVIPTLCHHPDLKPVGTCRLCLVEVEGEPGEPLHAACVLPAIEGMVVQTESPALAAHRRRTLEFLLRHFQVSGNSPAEQDNEFLRWVRHYGALPPADWSADLRFCHDSDPNPFIRVDFNQCILCTRCIRACNEIQGRFVWHLALQGEHSQIVAGTGTTMLDARCESCGACEAYCPTGALIDRFTVVGKPPERHVRTTCGYCGVGCQFDLNVSQGRVTHVTSSPDAPVNGMSLCVKGRYGNDFLHHPDRLTAPRVRQYLLTSQPRGSDGDRGDWIETDWETALTIVARKLHEVRCNHGSDAIGLLASAKCTDEENYLIQKLARQVIGTHNIDHCARLCHASTVAGLRMALGSGAMSNSMRDIVEHANSMFVIGSNTTEQHPVFGAMIRQAVLRRGMKLVVADPRRIELTEFAALHLRQRPGTDVALLNGLMHVILRQGWHNRDFIDARCEGFDELQQCLENYPPQRAAEITGVPVAEIERAAEMIATNPPMAAVWAMGITQHTTGVLNVLSLANLQLLLGNLGIPGGGVNPLRGQNNVQGACDMGALPDLLPGYQSVADDSHREKFARAWRLTGDEPPWSARPGLTVTEMIAAGGTGDLRALYILGEDPALTDPDSNDVRRNLQQCEFVVLQEIFPSETSHFADVLLPGAAFAEKDGTFTNTERRVQLLRQAINPPGDARPDWQILADVARRMLTVAGRTPLGPQAGWDYSAPSDIMDEIAALTPSYAGISHARLQRGEQLLWPVPDRQHPGTPILHRESFPRGRGCFHAVDHLPAQELPDQEYPLLLTTGRVLYHWHGGELTRRAQGLLAICPGPLVEISPQDAAWLGIADGAPIKVGSRRGEMSARASVTPRVDAGVVFANFHFPGAMAANNLTIAALDPVAKIPEYKVCAVHVAPQ